jgi:site-specific DNA recombinase
LKVAGYLRKSTDEDGKQVYSLDAQERAISECVKARGWSLEMLYQDEGVSGTVFDRPGLRKMRQDARKGLFDLVLVVNFDRLSRDNSDAALIRKELQSYGVGVAETVAPDLDSASTTGKLIFNVKSTMAEFEHDLISERTSRAMKYAQSSGRHMGRPPFGFYIREDGKLALDETGEKARKLLEMNPKMGPGMLARELGVDYFKARRLIQNVLRLSSTS